MFSASDPGEIENDGALYIGFIGLYLREGVVCGSAGLIGAVRSLGIGAGDIDGAPVIYCAAGSEIERGRVERAPLLDAEAARVEKAVSGAPADICKPVYIGGSLSIVTWP